MLFPLCLCYNVGVYTPVVPLTPSNVIRAVKKVKRWWGILGLRYRLYIPWSKEKEIRRKFPHEMDQKKQAISYWINTDPLASWRRLIKALDEMSETKLADSIRSNAEPLTGIQYAYRMAHVHCTLLCREYQMERLYG